MGDAPISAVVPFRYHKHLVETCSAIKNGSEVKSNLQTMKEYEFIFPTLSISITHGFGAICANFLEYLVDKVKKVHVNDRAELLEHVESGIYNPESGVAYYFTPHGSRVHKQPDFAINPVSKTYDNDPMMDDKCSKKFPSVSFGVFCYMFLWFLPCTWALLWIPSDTWRRR